MGSVKLERLAQWNYVEHFQSFELLEDTISIGKSYFYSSTSLKSSLGKTHFDDYKGWGFSRSFSQIDAAND